MDPNQASLYNQFDMSAFWDDNFETALSGILGPQDAQAHDTLPQAATATLQPTLLHQQSGQAYGQAVPDVFHGQSPLTSLQNQQQAAYLPATQPPVTNYGQQHPQVTYTLPGMQPTPSPYGQLHMQPVQHLPHFQQPVSQNGQLYMQPVQQVAQSQQPASQNGQFYLQPVQQLPQFQQLAPQYGQYNMQQPQQMAQFQPQISTFAVPPYPQPSFQASQGYLAPRSGTYMQPGNTNAVRRSPRQRTKGVRGKSFVWWINEHRRTEELPALKEKLVAKGEMQPDDDILADEVFVAHSQRRQSVRLRGHSQAPAAVPTAGNGHNIQLMAPNQSAAAAGPSYPAPTAVPAQQTNQLQQPQPAVLPLRAAPSSAAASLPLPTDSENQSQHDLAANVPVADTDSSPEVRHLTPDGSDGHSQHELAPNVAVADTDSSPEVRNLTPEGSEGHSQHDVAANLPSDSPNSLFDGQTPTPTESEAAAPGGGEDWIDDFLNPYETVDNLAAWDLNNGPLNAAGPSEEAQEPNEAPAIVDNEPASGPNEAEAAQATSTIADYVPLFDKDGSLLQTGADFSAYLDA